MVVHLLSPNDRYDMTYLRNYAVLNVKDRLARIEGVGQVQLFGSGDYSMRVWLDPQKVAERGLSASDVVREIRAQNVQAAAGVVGASPSEAGLDLQLSVNAQGRLQTEEEFGEIIVKNGANGEVTRLRDVARIELGAADYSLRSLLDNKSAVAVPIFQAPGSNAIADLRQRPHDDGRDEAEHAGRRGLQIVYDPTQFVRASIEAVIHTLLEAVALVVLVVILFLQTWRASIIPLIAVPVSIIGTFAVMHVFGFSINALTPVRAGAGDRHRRRRRHRRGRERRAQHRAGAVAARRDLSGDAGSHRPDHRDRAGADRGVRAAGLHHGPDRPVLQAVRADDRDLDGDLGVQFADAVAGAGGAAAEIATTRRRTC